jgi:hypothetical protein
MNMFKKRIDSFFKFFLRTRSERSLIKNVDRKITALKKAGRFRSFPISENPPLIANYAFFRTIDIKWLDLFYSIFDQPDTGFIPLPVYYNYLEPRLNNILMTAAIKEKNFYDKFLKQVKTPQTIIRRINGCFYDIDYQYTDLDDGLIYQRLKDIPAVIIKPSVESGSGRSIMKFTREKDRFSSGNELLTTDFLKRYGNDFVLQLLIKQHEFFSQFNPESNNTVRVMTYRSVKNDKISILHTLLRIGTKGSFLDHDNLGGVAISINNKGFLNEYAHDANGRKYDSFNGITFNQVGEVPFIKEISKSAIYIAEQVHYGRLLAMDFTIDYLGEIILIEINCKGNGISQYQYSNGSLFKEFTKEILDYCNNSSTKINIIQTRAQ